MCRLPSQLSFGGSLLAVWSALILFPILTAVSAHGQGDSPASATGVTASQAGASPQTNVSLPAQQTAPADLAPLQISAGDLLDVEVFDTPELSAPKVRVSQDGSVRLPVLGDVSVRGLSPRNAAISIETDLRSQQLMLDPHVVVLVNEYASQGIRVLGQVRNPGTYTLLGQHSLLDVLSAAGGTTPEQGGTITITHPDDLDHPEVLNVYTSRNSELEAHTRVRPGDVVTVAKADPFYITGDVGQPGQYFIGNGRPLHLVEGIALARGVTATAAVTHTAILRKTPNGTVRIPINLRRVEHNTDPDPLLQADDVIIIPRSGLKQVTQYAIPYAAGIIVGTAVTRAIP